MATLSNNAIARAIYLASKKASISDQGELVKKVVNFLDRRHLFGRVKSILAELAKVINQEEGRLVVLVKSTKFLDEETRTSLMHALKKRYPGMSISLSQELDEGLLGGIRLEVNDEVIDLSVKNKIVELKEYLTRSHE